MFKIQVDQFGYSSTLPRTLGGKPYFVATLENPPPQCTWGVAQLRHDTHGEPDVTVYGQVRFQVRRTGSQDLEHGVQKAVRFLGGVVINTSHGILDVIGPISLLNAVQSLSRQCRGGKVAFLPRPLIRLERLLNVEIISGMDENGDVTRVTEPDGALFATVEIERFRDDCDCFERAYIEGVDDLQVENCDILPKTGYGNPSGPVSPALLLVARVKRLLRIYAGLSAKASILSWESGESSLEEFEKECDRVILEAGAAEVTLPVEIVPLVQKDYNF